MTEALKSNWMLLAGALVAGAALALVLKPIVAPCDCHKTET